MLMVSAFINAQAGQRIAANDRIRNHAFHGELHCEIRARFHQRAVLDLFEVADIAGMMVIHLLLELVACENGLVSVDNNDMVAAIGIGRKGRLVLAAQQNGGLAATRPIGLPAASSTYQLRVMSPAFGI